ncbi:MAG: sodium/proline symporter PutP [Oligoflexia bacterium]|nr:sodium/proline symporter PutP [Oligoflexia bacterium]
MVLSNVSVWTYVSFSLYLLAMLAIGVYFFYKTKNLSDYILGGRSLGAWVTALSAFASDMSGWLLMGLPGLAFATGLAEPLWTAVGLVFGSLLNWLLVARRLRRYTYAAGDAHTLSDYFENRFQDKSRLLRVISSLFTIFFFTIYTAAQFVAGGKLFQSVLGLDYSVGLLIMACSLTLYIFLGGFLAVCWTDFFQGVLMLGALIVVPLMAIYQMGGITAINLDVNYLQLFNSGKGGETPLSTLALLSMLAWGLGYFGQPHILVRFMSISHEEELPKATTIATSWTFISMAMAIFIGLIGALFVANNGMVLSDPERIFIVLINATMHPFIGGLMLAAILAAAQSTAASQILVSSSSFVEDLYRTFTKTKKEKAQEKKLLLLNRLAVIGVMLIAALIAGDPESNVLKIVAYAWGGLGAAFGPLILFSLYWKRMTRYGALAGMIVGGSTTIIWKHLIAPMGGIFAVYELLPAFVLSTLAIVLVSLNSTAPSSSLLTKRG